MAPGIELRLYDTDPDDATARAEAHGMTILAPPLDKPHGLREGLYPKDLCITILDSFNLRDLILF